MDTNEMPEPVKGKTTSIYDDFVLEGMEKGEAKGIEKTRKENAVNFYKNGVSVEIIAASLSLKKNEVLKILKDAGLNPE